MHRKHNTTHVVNIMPGELDSLLRSMIDDLPVDHDYYIKTTVWDAETDEDKPKVGLEVVWTKNDG